MVFTNFGWSLDLKLSETQKFSKQQVLTTERLEVSLAQNYEWDKLSNGKKIGEWFSCSSTSLSMCSGTMGPLGRLPSCLFFHGASGSKGSLFLKAIFTSNSNLFLGRREFLKISVVQQKWITNYGYFGHFSSLKAPKCLFTNKVSR